MIEQYFPEKLNLQDREDLQDIELGDVEIVFKAIYPGIEVSELFKTDRKEGTDGLFSRETMIFIALLTMQGFTNSEIAKFLQQGLEIYRKRTIENIDNLIAVQKNGYLSGLPLNFSKKNNSILFRRFIENGLYNEFCELLHLTELEVDKIFKKTLLGIRVNENTNDNFRIAIKAAIFILKNPRKTIKHALRFIETQEKVDLNFLVNNIFPIWKTFLSEEILTKLSQSNRIKVVKL